MIEPDGEGKHLAETPEEDGGRDSGQILVVDDTAANLKFLVNMLSSRGYQVRAAGSGPLALRSIAVEQPDLILLDVRMPGMDGFEVCRRLKEDRRYRDIPVIFLSALNDTPGIVRAFEIGAVDYVTKPFEPAEILARIETHLKLHRLQQRMESLVAARTEELSRTMAEVEKSLEEKETLLHEIYHRVKNNLQIVISMLNLQRTEYHDSMLDEVLRMAQDRIRSMALVHDLLYQSEYLSHIDFAQYITQICGFLFLSYNISEARIQPEYRLSNVTLGLTQAIPCGLAVNELVTNSLKHAFPGDMAGNILIELCTLDSGRVFLKIADDGVGIPDSFDVDNNRTIGLTIVDNLVRQLSGTLEITSKRGTEVTILFPVE